MRAGPLSHHTRPRDLGVAVGEVYRADPTFVPPQRLWARLETALPHLLGA